MADEPPARCSALARQRCDSLAGTAAPATGWLLIEHNGPWARRALEDSPLDPVAGRAIVARARSAGVRPLFVRRHGRRKRRDTHRFAFVDATLGTASWAEYARLSELVDAEWSAAGGEREPIFLVCTHGRHDRCCAINGRPLAVELSARRRQQTWECSHVGGDRFAANVVVLPSGLYYGYAEPSDADEIVAATEAGQIIPRLLRGRATDPPLVQAARIAAHEALAVRGVDDLTLLQRRAEGSGRWLVSFADRTGRLAAVTVAQVAVPDTRPTCSHHTAVPMRELRAVSVEVGDR